ncbi:MAG: thermonuclease family protein [Pseudomonadota bacterium]
MIGLHILAADALLVRSANAVVISGEAVVVGGDVLRIGGSEMRIYGIDAPEAGQACRLPRGTWDCAKAAAGALAAMTSGETVHCEVRQRDEYGQLVARCSTREVPDIGARLVASGLAWAFVKYSADYIDLEMAPRRHKTGIWQSKTQPPWEYRAARWAAAKQIAPEGCPIKGNITVKGQKIYHAPWSRHYAGARIDQAKGERWFCTEAEAIDAGWRASHR